MITTHKMKTKFCPNINKQIQNKVNRIETIPFEYYQQCCKCLDYPHLKYGTNAVYFKKGQIGIKIIRKIGRYVGGEGYPQDGWKTKKQLSYSREWQKALNEFKILIKLKQFDFVPDVYALKSININKYWFPCLIMQHIEGEEVSDTNTKGLLPLIKKVENFLGKRLLDHYYHNFIVKQDGKIFLIDFDIDYIC